MAYRDKNRASQYANEYNNINYDRFTLLLPKGYKDTLKRVSRDCGLSVNSWIRNAIDIQLASALDPLAETGQTTNTAE